MLLIVAWYTAACQEYSNTKNMNTKETSQSNNPLLCDPQTGSCEVDYHIENDSASNHEVQLTEQQLKIIYFTDPICSSCWGIEPQLKRLKLEYGEQLDITYRMGGLLPDWSYNSGGISKPSDVAHHWDEVSAYYDMPIDGDVWLEDPLDSSYPPSITFKAAQLQSSKKALLFLRAIREMVFLKKVNISKQEHLLTAAKSVGLDEKQLQKDILGKALLLFQEDLELARKYGVRGFPTLIFINKSGVQEMIFGAKAYTDYEAAVQKALPTIVKNTYDKDWETLFSKFKSLTAREFSELSETPRAQAEQVLNTLTQKGFLLKFSTKNGSIWTKQ